MYRKKKKIFILSNITLRLGDYSTRERILYYTNGTTKINWSSCLDFIRTNWENYVQSWMQERYQLENSIFWCLRGWEKMERVKLVLVCLLGHYSNPKLYSNISISWAAYVHVHVANGKYPYRTTIFTEIACACTNTFELDIDGSECLQVICKRIKLAL